MKRLIVILFVIILLSITFLLEPEPRADADMAASGEIVLVAGDVRGVAFHGGGDTPRV